MNYSDNNLVDLKNKYKKGLLSKSTYISRMHKFHAILHKYSDFIKDTDISSVEIRDGQTTMTARKSGIKLFSNGVDERIIPVEILNFGNFEAEFLEIILEMIADNGVIIDIGANVGWYSLNLAISIKKSKIYALEPIPSTFKMLGKNIALNNFSNISLFNIGLGDKKSISKFYYYPEGAGNASLKKLAQNRRLEIIKCHIDTLDNFIIEKKITRLDFIKCDVEGAELLVFKGGVETIKKYKPVIFTEMLRKWSKKFSYHPNDIIGLFNNIGYKCFVMSQGKLTNIYKINDNTKDTNFFFLNTVSHGKLLKKLS
jgi:FkbM family methyltransferase